MKHSIKAVSKRVKKYKQDTAAQRTAAWREFLKRDVDWDYSSILRMLVFKLGRMQKAIVGNDIHTDAKNVGAEIEQVIGLLKRVDADEYMDELTKPLEKKYGKREIYFEDLDDGSRFSRMLHRYSKKLTKKQIERADAEYHAAYRRADELRHDDLALAMTIMAECLFGWWD